MSSVHSMHKLFSILLLLAQLSAGQNFDPMLYQQAYNSFLSAKGAASDALAKQKTAIGLFAQGAASAFDPPKSQLKTALEELEKITLVLQQYDARLKEIDEAPVALPTANSSLLTASAPKQAHPVAARLLYMGADQKEEGEASIKELAEEAEGELSGLTASHTKHFAKVARELSKLFELVPKVLSKAAARAEKAQETFLGLAGRDTPRVEQIVEKAGEKGDASIEKAEDYNSNQADVVTDVESEIEALTSSAKLVASQLVNADTPFNAASLGPALGLADQMEANSEQQVLQMADTLQNASLEEAADEAASAAEVRQDVQEEFAEGSGAVDEALGDAAEEVAGEIEGLKNDFGDLGREELSEVADREESTADSKADLKVLLETGAAAAGRTRQLFAKVKRELKTRIRNARGAVSLAVSDASASDEGLVRSGSRRVMQGVTRGKQQLEQRVANLDSKMSSMLDGSLLNTEEMIETMARKVSQHEEDVQKEANLVKSLSRSAESAAGAGRAAGGFANEAEAMLHTAEDWSGKLRGASEAAQKSTEQIANKVEQDTEKEVAAASTLSHKIEQGVGKSLSGAAREARDRMKEVSAESTKLTRFLMQSVGSVGANFDDAKTAINDSANVLADARSERAAAVERLRTLAAFLRIQTRDEQQRILPSIEATLEEEKSVAARGIRKGASFAASEADAARAAGKMAVLEAVSTAAGAAAAADKQRRSETDSLHGLARAVAATDRQLQGASAGKSTANETKAALEALQRAAALLSSAWRTADANARGRNARQSVALSRELRAAEEKATGQLAARVGAALDRARADRDVEEGRVARAVAAARQKMAVAALPAGEALVTAGNESDLAAELLPEWQSAKAVAEQARKTLLERVAEAGEAARAANEADPQQHVLAAVDKTASAAAQRYAAALADVIGGVREDVRDRQAKGSHDLTAEGERVDSMGLALEGPARSTDRAVVHARADTASERRTIERDAASLEHGFTMEAGTATRNARRQQHQVHERAVNDKSARAAEAASARRVDANVKSQAGNVGIEMQYAGRMSGQLLASADPSLAEEKSRSTLRAVGARLANSTEVAKLRSADLLGVALGTASKVGEVAKADAADAHDAAVAQADAGARNARVLSSARSYARGLKTAVGLLVQQASSLTDEAAAKLRRKSYALDGEFFRKEAEAEEKFALIDAANDTGPLTATLHGVNAAQQETNILAFLIDDVFIRHERDWTDLVVGEMFRRLGISLDHNRQYQPADSPAVSMDSLLSNARLARIYFQAQIARIKAAMEKEIAAVRADSSLSDEESKRRIAALLSAATGKIATVRGLVLKLSRAQSGTVARVEKDLAHLDRLASVAAQLTSGDLSGAAARRAREAVTRGLREMLLKLRGLLDQAPAQGGAGGRPVAGKAAAPSLLLEMQRRDGLRHKDDQALTSALRGFSALLTATIH